jgi:hypothetical protein
MADARDPAGPMPNTTIKIEKTIRNAPSPDEEEMEVVTETRKPGRPRKGTAQAESEPEENEDAVASYLQDHTVKIHIDRVSPREYKGKAIGGMIEEYVPPITIEEIETDIRNRFGGGRYRIRVLKNGRFVGARGLNIYGDPKVAEAEDDPDFGEDFNPAAFARDPFPGGPPVVDDEITELRKQIEKEKLKNALDEVKGRMGPSNAQPHVDPDRIRREEGERVRKEMETRREMDNLKNDMDHKLERFMSGMKELLTSQKQVDPARDHDIVSLDNKIERFKTEVMANVQTSMGEIKSMLANAQKAPEKVDNTPLMMTALIDGFSKMAASGESKVHAIASAETAKTQAMMESMKAIADAQMKVSQAQSDKLMTVIQSQNPQGIGEMSKTVGAVRDMAEALGWAPGGGGGPEVPAESPDIMSRVMGMVEKALPSLLAANAAKSRQTGQQLNQGEIQNIIAQQAQAAAKQIAVPMAEQMAAKRVSEIMAAQAAKTARDQQAAQELAAKKRADQQVQDFQRPPVVPPAAAPVNVAPPVVAAATPPPTPAPVQETAAAAAEEQIPVVIPETAVAGTSDNEVEAEKSNIVNACMEVLMKEVKIRPRKPEWNEVAYDELPEDVVEKLVMVTDADGLLTVIQPYTKPEYLENLKNVFASDQRAVDWFVKGLNEMKEWYAEEGQPQVAEEQAQA